MIICLFIIIIIVLIVFLFRTMRKEVRGNKPPLDLYLEDKNTNTFVAIDVETATAKGNVCQIAYVYVKEGEFVSQNSFFVRPSGNKYDSINVRIHHITPDKTANSQSIKTIWPEIESKIYEAGAVVAHNADFDIPCIQKSLNYGTDVFDKVRIIDTCKITNYASLYSCCVYFGIELAAHHDALCDALACAQLLLKLKDFPIYGNIPKVEEPKPNNCKSKEDIEIIYPDTIFTDKTCVYSGVFTDWPEREELEVFLLSCGAKVRHSISSKTEFFITGSSPGPSKMQKALELNSAGANIQFIDDIELGRIVVDILSNCAKTEAVSSGNTE